MSDTRQIHAGARTSKELKEDLDRLKYGYSLLQELSSTILDYSLLRKDHTEAATDVSCALRLARKSLIELTKSYQKELEESLGEKKPNIFQLRKGVKT